MGSRDLIFLSLFSIGTAVAAVGCGDGDLDAFSWGETPPSSKPFSVTCTQKKGCGTAYDKCVADREESCSACYSNCDLETCSACVSACDR